MAENSIRYSLGFNSFCNHFKIENMSFEGGYQSDVAQTDTSAVGGAIFITNVEPQSISENVATKVFSSDEKVLQSCSSSTDLVKVTILAITGFSTFKPVVMVENLVVALIQDEDQNVWTGTIDINLNGKAFIEAIHNDGAFHRCMISSEQNPEIISAIFSGGYPEQQTELKENDVFNLTVEASLPFTTIEIADYGAAKAQLKAVALSTNSTIQISVANRGSVANSYGLKVRVISENGTKSNWYLTEENGSVDGVHLLVLNNLSPTILINEIVYPESQGALKNNESVQLKNILSDYDEVVYLSENEELNILESTIYSPTKTITRIGGNYNVAVPNLTIQAKRIANGSITVLNEIVRVANVAPSITFIEPEIRFVSGGNANTPVQSHFLRITSDQKLLSTPTLLIPEGTLENEAKFNSETNQYEQSILIHDNDEKGTFSAQLIIATNLAGLVSNAFKNEANYVIGGFVKRTLQFQAFSNETALGTSIVNTQKLSVTDKDGIRMNYAASIENNQLSYTITNPPNQVNPKGNIFHWNDEQAVNNNSTGLATISIEELP
jgi:hypothetical protein